MTTREAKQSQRDEKRLQRDAKWPQRSIKWNKTTKTDNEFISFLDDIAYVWFVLKSATMTLVFALSSAFFLLGLSNYHALLWEDFHNALPLHNNYLISLIGFLSRQNPTVRKEKWETTDLVGSVKMFIKQHQNTNKKQHLQKCALLCLSAQLDNLLKQATGLQYLKSMTLIFN